MAGVESPPITPDLTIEKATLDPKSCEVSFVFTNLNAVALGDYAWRDDGVKIIRIDMITNARADDIGLNTIDPNKTFTRVSRSLAWSGERLIPHVAEMRVGLWYVRGDFNFDNNHLDISISEPCRKF